LLYLIDANQLLCHHEEAIEWAKEALGVWKQLGDVVGQAASLQWLAWVLYEDKQLMAAGGAASQATNLSLSKNEPVLTCHNHCVLGNIHCKKDDMEGAIYHFKEALTHSGHWGEIRAGLSLVYGPIRSNISHIFLTSLMFVIQ